MSCMVYFLVKLNFRSKAKKINGFNLFFQHPAIPRVENVWVICQVDNTITQLKTGAILITPLLMTMAS